MDIISIREYCISKENVSECMPFDDETLVFKKGTKIFAMANLEGELQLNLKCNPEYALELREKYSSVTPGYHMNKKHWNTISIDGLIPDKEIFEWIDHSYNIVKAK